MNEPIIRKLFVLWMALCALCAPVGAADSRKASVRSLAHPKPTNHVQRAICGWAVRVDDRLLGTNHGVLGERALKLLEARLVVIAAVMPEKPLARLRQVPIQIDLRHGELDSMAYHPSLEGSRDGGYDTNPRQMRARA